MHSSTSPTASERLTVPSIPADIASLHDYERHARRLLPEALYEHIASGSADDNTLVRNARALSDRYIWPRALVDVRLGTTRTTLLGQTLAHPIMLGPVAYQNLVHPDGEVATAQGAEATDTPLVLSCLSSRTMEDVARNHKGTLWFQLYWQPDFQMNLNLVQRAQEAGYGAIVLTVDAPVQGLRDRARRAGFVFPESVRAVNLPNSEVEPLRLDSGDNVVLQGAMANAPRWCDLGRFAQSSSLPVIVKGILHPDDATLAIGHGAKGIVVSNHGGRALDGVPASLDVLGVIRNAVGPEVPVMLDGGIRRGTDVFKALALGADAVMIGRPQLYALRVAGNLGVAHMLKLLSEELAHTMALAGCPRISDISPQALYPANLPC